MERQSIIAIATLGSRIGLRWEITSTNLKKIRLIYTARLDNTGNARVFVSDISMPRLTLLRVLVP